MDKITKIFACGLLALMFILMFASSWNDSATFDEVAHTPAGYSYLTQKDYRLNPEHPPLIKDLSAIPLLIFDLNFPSYTPEWKNGVNEQWKVGNDFLYESGNNPDTIIRFSRFPIMLLALLFGWLLFKWVRGLYGNKVGLLTLFFYSLSPTMIAHSRYVTTDLGSAFGFFISIASFVNFLHNQTKKNLIIAGIAFGIAQLLKFSMILLLPTYFILGILWVILENYHDKKKIIKQSFVIIKKLILIGIVSLLIVWPIYQFNVWNYPAEKQLQDTQALISSFRVKSISNFVIWLSDKPVLHSIGHYFLGILMVLQRTAGGNNYYFMGNISNVGSPAYFPFLYLVKELFAFHILTLIAIIFSIRNIIKTKEKSVRVVVEWMRDNFAITASIIFVSIYLLQSITGNLNIGLRHILPVLPFIYFLVARQIIRWVKKYEIEEPETIFQHIKYFFKKILNSLERSLLLIALLTWMFVSILLSFPYYLSYYNFLGGGTENGYKIATDSNYDWGQDLKRLRNWTEKNNVDKIAIDYFGGGSPKYYFGVYPEGKFEPWWSSRGPIEEGYLAVSLNVLQGSLANPTNGMVIKPEDSYWWLKDKKPVARAGTSIFIYKF